MRLFTRMQEQCDSAHAKIKDLLDQLNIQSERIDKLSAENEYAKVELMRLKKNFSTGTSFGDLSSPSGQEQDVYVFRQGDKFHKIGDGRCHLVSTIAESSGRVASVSYRTIPGCSQVCSGALQDVFPNRVGVGLIS